VRLAAAAAGCRLLDAEAAPDAADAVVVARRLGDALGLPGVVDGGGCLASAAGAAEALAAPLVAAYVDAVAAQRGGGGGGGDGGGGGHGLCPTGGDEGAGDEAEELAGVADAVLAATSALRGRGDGGGLAGGGALPPASLAALQAADAGLWHRVVHGGQW